MRRRVLSLLLVALASGCDSPTDQIDEVRERLVGTWLRDYELEGTRIRRVLVLGADGLFIEKSRSLGPQELGIRHNHEGEWLYDGTNLKRRYRMIDGERVSAPTVPFAALQVRFTSSHEFIGKDNVRGRELRYQRVPMGTDP